jgi:hypothetical protein
VPNLSSKAVTAAEAVAEQQDDDMDTDSDYDEGTQYIFTTPHTPYFTTFTASTTAQTNSTMLDAIQTSMQGKLYVVSNNVI